MKIGQFEPKATPASTPATQPERNAGKAGGATPEPSAKVALSSSAALGAEGADPATFDEAKVERISQAIRDGHFKVDAGAIADKLIANAQELLGRGSSR
jgi:negative regulator of flagellin synthesis FlgM